MQDLKRIFIDNGEIKTAVAIVAVFISWSFNGEYQALMAISSLIVFDFITGTHCALKTGTWKSRRSIEGVAKFGRYLIYMLVARMIDKVVPLKFASPIMDTYIAITEAGSILENFAKLGYDVPMVLLNKLKSFYEKKS